MSRRVARFAAATFAGAALIGACATGGGSGTGDDDGGPGGSVTGPGGMGGAASSSSGIAGMGGSMPASSSSSTGTPCEEQPCKLLAPQCGCAMGERCVLDNNGMKTCDTEGTAAVGEACGGAAACQAGGQCLTTLGQSMCREYCDDDSQCDAPGGICAIQVNDGMGGSWDQKFCSENCDPVSGAGCAPATAKCEMGQEQDGQMRYFTICTGSGAGTQGAACTDTGDCAAGYGCFNAGTLQCLKWCSPTNNPTCPGVTVCSPFQPGIFVSTVEYGACL